MDTIVYPLFTYNADLSPCKRERLESYETGWKLFML